MRHAVVFISGASSGIGAATAKFLLEKGCSVCVGTRETNKTQELIDYAQKLGRGAHLFIVTCDVNSEHSVEQAVEKSITHFGRIDVLVNNAGYAIVGAIADFTAQEIETQFNTNLLGAHRLIRALLPHFKKQHSGTIINISSMGGKITFPFYAIYNSSKYALEAYTEGLWMELRHSQIHVYLVEPGLIDTPFYARSMRFPRMWKETTSIYKKLYEDYTAHPEHVAFPFRSSPKVVARKIHMLIQKSPTKLRHPVGNFAGLLLFFRWLLPDMLFLPFMSRSRG